MRSIVGRILFAISAILIVSLFVTSIAARLDLARKGVLFCTLRDSAAAPAYGFVSRYSVWQRDKLIGHIVTGGDFIPLERGELGATEFIDWFALRAFLGLSAFVIAVVLIYGPNSGTENARRMS
jgi:hypothetical protein